MSSNSSSTTPELLTAALDSFIPGFSLFARITSNYLRIDVSSFSIYLVLFVVLPLFFGLFFLRLFSVLQQVLLWFTVSVEIPYQDKLHKQFVQWMSTNDSLRQTRHSIARTKSDIILPWQLEEDDDQDEDPVKDQEHFKNDRKGLWLARREKENMKPIKYTPCKDTWHILEWKGRYFVLRRKSRENPNGTFITDTETITVYCFFWTRSMLYDLFKEVQKASVDKKKTKITIYYGTKEQKTTKWKETASIPPREPSTLAFAPYIKETFLEDIETFLSPKNEQWYQSRGIPYRRGYLLYGPPGTGKSSMCSVIAGSLFLDIYTINLNSRHLDEDGLTGLFRDLPRCCIVLLEDVDEAGIQNRRTQEQTNAYEPDDPLEDNQVGGLSLSALLNCLDGVGAQEGRILIMTTNHEDNLDEALKRPGRVDQRYYFGYADTPTIKQLFEIFYDGEIDAGSTPSLSDQFAGMVPSEQFTPAEINNYLMNLRGKPDEAVAKALDWVMHKKKAVTSRA